MKYGRQLMAVLAVRRDLEVMRDSVWGIANLCESTLPPGPGSCASIARLKLEVGATDSDGLKVRDAVVRPRPPAWKVFPRLAL